MEIENNLINNIIYCKKIVDNIEDGILIINRDYIIEGFNSAIINLTKRKEKEIIGRPCYEITHNSQSPCSDDFHQCPVKYVLEKEGTFRIVHTHIAKNGEERYHEIVATPFRDEKGELKIIETIRDVTEKVKIEKRLEGLLKDLENRVEEKTRELLKSERLAIIGKIAMEMAHEINNPLGIIKNYLRISMDRTGDLDINKRNLVIINEEIERIERILREFTTFHQIGVTSKGEPVNINNVINEIINILEDSLLKKGIRIIRDLKEDIPLLSVSSDRIKQVIINIIKNAEESMENGGVLKIETDKKGKMVELKISDTGIGIAPNDIKNIFEPFFTKKREKGLGIGLFLSYAIIKSYNGNIDVESRLSEGTTFIITLPIC
jgi:PAS domain S-box-containing protein